MKKILLPFVVALLSLASCTDYTDDFNTINNRLDALEQTLPSIEEQIETLNSVTAELEKVDEELKKALNALKSDIQANAKDIEVLETQAEILETRIAALNNYVNSEIVKVKDAAAAAYATIDALNDAKSELNALQATVANLSAELNAKIDSVVSSLTSQIDQAVKTLNDKIAELEARLKAVEDKVENLLARIQSVSYVPQYSDGKAQVTRIGAVSEVILDFKVSPKECVAELEKVWSEALSCEAVYTKTRAVSLVKMAVIKFEADAENGVITVTASCENLSEEFFAGTQEASVALVISDENNYVTSEYIPMVAKEITDEIWYTTTDGQPLTPNHEGVDIFGANIVSNTYNEESGWFVLKFDGPVTLIGKRAFGTSAAGSASTLQEIVIPNSVTSIGDWAFSYCCDELISIVIPDNVTSIGRTALASLGKLESVTLGKNVETLGSYAFSKCSSLKNINLPESLTAIPDGCFRYCSSLASITIPDSVTKIEKYAFYECSALTSVTIGNGVTEIGEQAFKHTTSKLSRLEIPSSVKVIGKQCFEYTEMQELILSEGLEEIGTGAFHCCLGITSLTIPNSVTKIGDWAFLNCKKLEKIYGKYSTADNYNVIVEDKLIWVSTFVTGDYEIPNNVKVVGAFAIAYPKNVITITIPESVEEFFRGEYRNSSFLLQDKVSALYGKYTTNDHRAVIKDNKLYAVATHGLSSYNVPEGVVEIEPRTLFNCGLREIILPSTLKILGQEQLKESKTLEYIYSKATTPPTIGDETFVNTVKLQKIYVPRNSVEAYKSAEYWNGYADYIEGYDF